MATNAAIRTALLAKLKVTPQRLSQLVGKRKAELPMSTEQAVYTLAHEHGIDVSKHLDKEGTAEVRELVAQLRSRPTEAVPSPAPAKAKVRNGSAPRPVLITIAGISVEKLPGLTAAHAKEAEQMAQKVYPALYVFENSARRLVGQGGSREDQGKGRRAEEG